jgi:hypothetical protein
MPTESRQTKLPEPWLSFLYGLDRQLEEDVELQCLGGFVLTVVYDVPRVTGDIDYITVKPRAAAQILEQLAGRESALAKK